MRKVNYHDFDLSKLSRTQKGVPKTGDFGTFKTFQEEEKGSLVTSLCKKVL